MSFKASSLQTNKTSIKSTGSIIPIKVETPLNKNPAWAMFKLWWDCWLCAHLLRYRCHYRGSHTHMQWECHCRLFRTQCSNSYHRSWISEVNKVVRKWGGALQVDLLCFNLQRDKNTLYYNTQAVKKPSTSCVGHMQTPGCAGTD